MLKTLMAAVIVVSFEFVSSVLMSFTMKPVLLVMFLISSVMVFVRMFGMFTMFRRLPVAAVTVVSGESFVAMVAVLVNVYGFPDVVRLFTASTLATLAVITAMLAVGVHTTDAGVGVKFLGFVDFISS